MAWDVTIYLCHPDEATARAEAAALGMVFPSDGSIPTGNDNFALDSPIDPPWQTAPVYGADANGRPTVVTLGVPVAGFWSMMRLNKSWPGYAATMAALQAGGRLRTLAKPPCVFA